MTVGRMMRETWIPVLLIVAAGCAGGATDEAPAASSAGRTAELTVHVVNYPLQYFAERIGGTHVRVEFPVPPDVDPAFWTPSAEIIAAYQAADLILLNGAGYAKWVANVSLPSASLVDTSAGFREELIAVADLETHAHGPQGKHEHGGVAFTTWLDPRLAVRQARAVEAAFSKARPDAAEGFQAGLKALEQDLIELDGELRRLAEGWAEPLLGSHPVYQYLARGYGLDVESVHFEPDEFPGETAWEELGVLMDRHPARWMLWEGAPLDPTVDRLRELGVGSLVYDPCGNRPAEGDFLTVQRANLGTLSRMRRAGS